MGIVHHGTYISYFEVGRVEYMRRRGLASPDDGDALALTFAYPVLRTGWDEERRIQEKIDTLKRYVV